MCPLASPSGSIQRADINRTANLRHTANTISNHAATPHTGGPATVGGAEERSCQEIGDCQEKHLHNVKHRVILTLSLVRCYVVQEFIIIIKIIFLTTTIIKNI